MSIFMNSFFSILPFVWGFANLGIDLQGAEGYENEAPNRGHLSEQLAEYLWENYIEYETPSLPFHVQSRLTSKRARPNDSKDIFFLGVGDAFIGLANLLVNKGTVQL